MEPMTMEFRSEWESNLTGRKYILDSLAMWLDGRPWPRDEFPLKTWMHQRYVEIDRRRDHALVEADGAS